jgi:hypothetical protein
VTTGGSFSAAAANDATVAGSRIAAGTSLGMAAGGALTIGAVKELAGGNMRLDQGKSEGSAQYFEETVRGSTLTAGEDVVLAAGASRQADLVVAGSTVASGAGAVTLAASGDIGVVSVAENRSRYATGRGKRDSSQSVMESSTAIGSVVAAGSDLTVVANAGSLTLEGSALDAGGDLAVRVAGDLNLLAATSRRYESVQSSRQTRKTLETLSFELDRNRVLLSTITAGNGIDLQVGGNVAAQVGTTDAEGRLQADRMTAAGVVEGADRQQVSVGGSGSTAGASRVLGGLAAQGIREGAADSFAPGAMSSGQAAVTTLLASGLVGIRNDPGIQNILATPSASAMTYKDDAGRVQLTLAGQARVQEIYSTLRLNETFDVKRMPDQGLAQVVTLAAAIALSVMAPGAGAALVNVTGTSALVANAAFAAMTSTMVGQMAGGASFGEAFEAGFKAGASSALTAGILNTPMIDTGTGMQSINQWAGIQDVAGTGAKLAKFDLANLGQNLGGMALRGTVNAGVSTAIYGGSFGDAFTQSFVSDLAAVGANAVGQTWGGGKNPFMQTVGHAAIGATAATLTGKDAVAGAIGGAGASLINPLLDQAIGGTDGSGWGDNPALRTAALQLGSIAATGAVAEALGKDGMTAALAAQNETVNNYLTQRQISSKQQELSQAKDAQQRADVEQKYAAIDSTQREAATQCLVNGNCPSVMDRVVLKQAMADLQAGCAPPRTCSADAVRSIAELQRIYGTASAITPVYPVEEFLVGGKGLEKLIGLAGTGVSSALTMGARDAAVELTREGERFVRVGARPENLKFTFEAPGGTQAGTYAFPEKTFLEIGQNPATLKNLGDLPGGQPQYFRILEPPAGTPIQRGIVPGGEFGGIGRVPEVLFPKGF